MRRVQLRGGARWQPARRTFCTLSRLSRAPYLRRWALLIALDPDLVRRRQAIDAHRLRHVVETALAEVLDRKLTPKLARRLPPNLPMDARARLRPDQDALTRAERR